MVRRLLEQENARYGFNSCWTHRGSTGLARHQLDCDTYLHLSYANIKDKWGNIADHDKVTSFTIVSIDELEQRVPEGTFGSICIIHHCPTPKPQGFDPIALIKAVNHFKGLGASETVRRLKIYHDLAISELHWHYDLDEQRLFFIIRLLFVRKDGDPRMPWMYIGATSPRIPDGSKDWPLFPLVVRGDIPLFMADEYMLAGHAESPLRHIEYCQEHCTVRKEPMTPSLSPIQAVEEVCGSEQWLALFATKNQSNTYPADGRHKYLLRCQAMRCFPIDVGLPVELPHKFHPYCVGPENADLAWTKYLGELKQIKVIWDPTAQEFRGKRQASNKTIVAE